MQPYIPKNQSTNQSTNQYQVEEQLRAEHARKSGALMDRLAARRAKKAALLEAQRASPEEVTEEMNELQELDAQELNMLSAELSQAVAQSVSEADTYQKTQMQDLLKEDVLIEVENTKEREELRRLIDTQLKSRADLESKLEAKRRAAGTKLKMRIAGKKQKVKESGSDDFSQIYEEEMRELQALDAAQSESEKALWSQAHAATAKTVLSSNALAAELQVRTEERSKETRIKRKHETAFRFVPFCSVPFPFVQATKYYYTELLTCAANG